ncbi:hypothetical protein [Xanthomonas hortorum]|uniref:hypothetical protein n=1 Tax=Xanthomonas hortorum TaxID=56454 RepID=UPI002935B54A|nr:hypothetical protein [Xanthomonas hortorum]MDV2451443.1 hypothetical protein [Xanthomonas hortorum NBC5720]
MQIDTGLHVVDRYDCALRIVRPSMFPDRLEAARAFVAGVQSVPHVIFDERLVLIGGHSEDELAQAIAATQ